MTTKSILIAGLLALPISCATPKPSPQGTPWVPHQSYHNTGVSQGQLDALTAYLESNLETTGMVILQGGKLLYEYGETDELGYLASCRKSVLSILYGKYVEDGTIDLQETIGSIGVEEDDGLLPIEKTATVSHIINSRSGVFHQPANGGYDKYNIRERGSETPGEYYVYNNWDFNVAGYILEAKTGRSVYEELEAQLAIPLGFQDWDLAAQKERDRPRRSRYPAYHMYLSTRDFAKIGQLMLNQGEWNGEQLVSAEWIEQITTPVTSVEEINERYGRTEDSPYQFAYGHMWWLIDNFRQHPVFEGAYSATGWGGQFLTVIPTLDMVIAHQYQVPTLVNWGIVDGGVGDREYWDLVYWFLTQAGEE